MNALKPLLAIAAAVICVASPVNLMAQDSPPPAAESVAAAPSLEERIADLIEAEIGKYE